MNRYIRCCLFLILCLTGCAHETVVPEPINLVGSTTRDVGNVLFDWGPPEEQQGPVIGYYIVIDDHKPILMDSLNNERVILAEGSHTVNIVSLAPVDRLNVKPIKMLMESEYYRYGKPSIGSFFLLDGGAAVIKYKHPLTESEEGQLTVQ